MLRPRSRHILACVFAIVLGVACQRAAPPPRAPSPPSTAPSATATAAAPAGHLLRAEVDQVLVQQGPPWVLRRIISEEVLRKDGKFTGWRMVGLPEEWSGIDLKPGDIVTRINGLPLETPDEAWEAWKSVARSPAIEVSLFRDGARRELVIPIDGAPSAETAKLLGREAPAPRPTAAPPKRGSVQLGGTAPPETSEQEAY